MAMTSPLTKSSLKKFHTAVNDSLMVFVKMFYGWAMKVVQLQPYMTLLSRHVLPLQQLQCKLLISLAYRNASSVHPKPQGQNSLWMESLMKTAKGDLLSGIKLSHIQELPSKLLESSNLSSKAKSMHNYKIEAQALCFTVSIADISAS